MKGAWSGLCDLLLPRDAKLSRYMLWLCVFPSVSVSHLGEIPVGSLRTVLPVRVVGKTLALFNQYLAVSRKRCNMGTVVTIDGEQKLVCAVSNVAISSDLG